MYKASSNRDYSSIKVNLLYKIGKNLVILTVVRNKDIFMVKYINIEMLSLDNFWSNQELNHLEIREYVLVKRTVSQKIYSGILRKTCRFKLNFEISRIDKREKIRFTAGNVD